jgi:HlyD family secretion protein
MDCEEEMLKKFITKKRAVIILLILISGFFVVRKVFPGKENGYILGKVQKQTITEIVSESGIVSTSGRINIYSPTNGLIDKMFVANGDKVVELQKLFTVKSTATPQEKAAALAAFQAAKTDVQQAENNRRSTMATVDRVHDDLKNNDKDETFIEKETRTTAEVANDNAYDELLSAQAQLDSLESSYQSTQNATVTAPISGMVSNLSIIIGSSVVVNSPVNPTTPVLIIGGAAPTEVAISIGESEINKIKIGQLAIIKLEAVGNKIYSGVVKRFDEHGTITGGVVKYNVYLEITNPDNQIKPGMTADADITTNQIANVLAVPNNAVKPYQKGRSVRKLGSNGEVEYITVKTGVRGKEFTQILEGLNEGQEIVMSLTNEKATRSNLFGL